MHYVKLIIFLIFPLTIIEGEKGMSEVSESALRMKEMIKIAIEDGELSTEEYEKIMAIADEDRHHDEQEKKLLRELLEMVSNGTVKRVR